MAHWDAAALTEWADDIFRACGVGSEHARLAAGNLVRANLRGIDTHGVARIPAYADKLSSGAMDPAARCTFEMRAGSLVCEAGRGLGQVAGAIAVERAVELCDSQAVAAVTLRDVGHLGALAILGLPAAEAGMIALICQNGPPLMAMPGGTKPAIGNNPIAFVAPAGKGRPPLAFDMATSEVSFGRIIEAARIGAPIPDNWALDIEGRPTIDAKAALDGMLLPSGGYKGLGIAMLVETLAGGLTGTDPMRTGNARSLPSAFGGFVLVVNPALLIGAEAFAAHMESWIATYRGSGAGMRYPGERAAECEAERMQRGIPLPEPLVASLMKLGQERGAPFPAPR